MSSRTYEEFNTEVMQFYREQAFDKALDLLTREGDRFPEEEANILYLRSCMAARVGQNDLAIQVLDDALDKGLWWSEFVMRETPSWKPLQGMPAFEHLVEVFKAKEEEAQTDASYITREPEGGCSDERPCPVLVALHGNLDNAGTALHGWRALASMGWLLAAVQSSQVMAANGYVWNDQDVAVRDIKEQFAKLSKQYTIDTQQIIVAGFSLGGETALRVALTGAIPVRGFILLGPGGPTVDEPEGWLPLIEQAQGSGLRGYILIGEEDRGIEQEAIRTLVKMLNEHNIPCELELLPNLRHEYPPDFAPSLSRGLAFILR